MHHGVRELQCRETGGSFVSEAGEGIVGFGEHGRGEEGGGYVALVGGEPQLGFEELEVGFGYGVGNS